MSTSVYFSKKNWDTESDITNAAPEESEFLFKINCDGSAKLMFIARNVISQLDKDRFWVTPKIMYLTDDVFVPIGLDDLGTNIANHLTFDDFNLDVDELNIFVFLDDACYGLLGDIFGSIHFGKVPEFPWKKEIFERMVTDISKTEVNEPDSPFTIPVKTHDKLTTKNIGLLTIEPNDTIASVHQRLNEIVGDIPTFREHQTELTFGWYLWMSNVSSSMERAIYSNAYSLSVIDTSNINFKQIVVYYTEHNSIMEYNPTSHVFVRYDNDSDLLVYYNEQMCQFAEGTV